MKEIGKILRDARLKQGLDLEKVHRTTKIQEKYITAIEEGDKDSFLAEIYYKSFVKSYAKFLGLDGEDLLFQYEKRKNADDGDSSSDEQYPVKNKPAVKSVKKDAKNSIDMKKLLITVLIAVSLFAVFMYLNNNIPDMLKENPDISIEIEQKKTELKQKEEMKRAQAEQKQKQAEEEKAEESKTLKPFPQKSVIPIKETALTANAVKQPEGAKKPVPVVSSEAASVNVAAPAPAAAVEQPAKRVIQELDVEAIENVWIKVDGDGRELFQGTIVKGTKKRWQAHNEFILKIGYTPGVNVLFNGEKVDIIKGSVQDVNTVTLSRQQR